MSARLGRSSAAYHGGKSGRIQGSGFPQFSVYAHEIVANSKALAEALMEEGVKLLTNGTDNHLLIMDVASSFQLTGRQAEAALREAKLTVNRNSIPFDVNGPWYTSGVRIGTPAVTTLGMKPPEMREIASAIAKLLRKTRPEIVEKTGEPSRAKVKIEPSALREAREEVGALLSRFPLYPELIVDEN